MNKRDDEEARAEGSARAEMLAQLGKTNEIETRMDGVNATAIANPSCPGQQSNP